MKVTLISLDPELYCIGLRILSSCLREKGKEVRILFLPPETNRLGKSHKFQLLHSEALLERVLSFCSDADLVGISLMTNQFLQAVNVTSYLKRHNLKTPIIWGGIHPTVEPEICLEYADIVCVGEGEDALVELAEHMEHRQPYLEVENMWFKSDKGIIRNPLRPLKQDLDKIPFPDYSFDNHFIAVNNSIVRLTPERLIKFEGDRFRANGDAINYPVLTSRGCPSNCTYCCNNVFRRLYPLQKHLRWRSAENVINELRSIQTEIAPLSHVYFVDDNFTARSSEKLKAFCDAYKHEIGIPFFAQVSPLTISNEKMEILISSGCIKVAMGVETGNERVARIYNREKSHAAVPAAISILEKYRSRMLLPPSYQFIIDNPFETIGETIDTLRLALSLPRPWDNPIYSLMLFPGTPLYEKACSEGLVKDKRYEIYGKDWHDQSRPFFQFWIRLYRANLSPVLLRLLLVRCVAQALSGTVAGRVLKSGLFRWLWETK